MKISTENLDKLPNSIELKKICKSISALEAIICPEWEFRYYSFQKNWSDNEDFCEMRNGQGDQMLILFQKNGICINGFAHESEMNGWKNNEVQKITKGVVDDLPKQFDEFIFGEPVKSIGTTFCIWSKNTEKWEVGQVELPKDDYKDGSKEMLELLDGKPLTYKNWAEEYYEEEFEEYELNIELVEQIYKGNILTKEMAAKINPNLEDYKQLKTDLDEIGYNYNFK